VAYHITLSEEDYAALVAASTQTGEPIEQLVHEAIAARYESPSPSRQIGNYRYPTGEPITDEEEEEMERLAQEIGPGTPLSEIIIEDRGPR
jgi:hypothetical protein